MPVAIVYDIVNWQCLLELSRLKKKELGSRPSWNVPLSRLVNAIVTSIDTGALCGPFFSNRTAPKKISEDRSPQKCNSDIASQAGTKMVDRSEAVIYTFSQL